MRRRQVEHAVLRLHQVQRFKLLRETRIDREGHDIHAALELDVPAAAADAIRHFHPVGQVGIGLHRCNECAGGFGGVLADNARQAAILGKIGLGERATALVDHAPGATLAFFLRKGDRLALLNIDAHTIRPEALHADIADIQLLDTVADRIGIGRQYARAGLHLDSGQHFCGHGRVRAVAGPRLLIGVAAGADLDVLHGNAGPASDHVEAVIHALAELAEAATHPRRNRQHDGATDDRAQRVGRDAIAEPGDGIGNVARPARRLRGRALRRRIAAIIVVIGGACDLRALYLGHDASSIIQRTSEG